MSLNKPVIFETTFTRYIGTAIIGEGGAGSIYQAVDDEGNIRAIKLLRSERAKGEKAKRFKNEVLFCSRNQHPNIMTVIEHGVLTDGKRLSPFYVMPLYTSSLKAIITAGIAQDKVLFYFGQILDGVEAAHLQQVIHRDLKPENILYDAQKDRLLIADFGIAHFEEKALYTSIETAPDTRLANFHYAAPEQDGRGTTIVDHRADIYALGLILNEMFTHQIPRGTRYKSIGSVAPDFSYLDDLVSAMLRQSVEERPASIEVLKRELIGHKQEFITRQRLSELKQMVVSVTDLDDPLIIDPPRLVGIDVTQGALILLLQRSVTSKWIQAWMQMARSTSYTSVMNKGPERFSFAENRATIPAHSENEMQQIVNHFNAWLPNANRVYREMVHREKQEAENQQRKQLQQEIEEQERRHRILTSIKI